MTNRILRAAVAALMVALVPAVAGAQTSASAPPPPPPLSLDFKPVPYKLGPGDKIRLRFTGLYPDDMEMNTQYEVAADGTIPLKYIGSIKAEGETEVSLRGVVMKALEPRFYPAGVVTLAVTLEGERLQEVFVQGHVVSAGRKELTGSQMTVARAIAAAGGVSSTGGEEIDVKRGDRVVISVTQTELNNGVDPQLQSGDTVSVKQGQFVFVNGEVNSSGQKKWEPGLTVSKALSLSGGMNTRGKLGYIRRKEIRDGKIVYTKIDGRRLTLNTILLPDDELYIVRKFFGGL